MKRLPRRHPLSNKFIKCFGIITALLTCAHANANFAQEGQNFGNGLLPNQGPSQSEGGISQKLAKDLPGFTNYQQSGVSAEEQREHGLITQSSNLFSTSLIKAKKIQILSNKT
jgi:hypothetical protein